MGHLFACMIICSYCEMITDQILPYHGLLTFTVLDTDVKA
jgi:hypothetical protein